MSLQLQAGAPAQRRTAQESELTEARSLVRETRLRLEGAPFWVGPGGRWGMVGCSCRYLIVLSEGLASLARYLEVDFGCLLFDVDQGHSGRCFRESGMELERSELGRSAVL